MSVLHFTRRLATIAGLAGLLGGLLPGCGGSGSSTSTGTGGGVTNPPAGRHANWTILVYMNAASNLQPDSLYNVMQMASVGSNSNINIVLQWKQTATPAYFSGVTPTSKPSFIGTRRYLISKHSQADLNRISPPGLTPTLLNTGDQNTVNQQVAQADTTVLDVDRLPDPATNTLTDSGNKTSDMGDYRTLADFVQYGAKTFPGNHLAVVIWDHGSGALDVINRAAGRSSRTLRTRVSKVSTTTRGLSQDTQTGNQISTTQIPLGLANPPQAIDDLIIDCSLQGTTEVAYEVRHSASYFVGTEESPPGTGLPYDVWMNYVSSNTPAPIDLGRNIVTSDYAAYPSYTNITQSLIDLSKMDALVTAINAFGASLNTHVADQMTLIANARQSAQYFDFAEYKDLGNFADRIRTSSGVSSDLAQAAANVETALTGSGGAVVLSQHSTAADSTGFSEANATGLSIFLPGPNTQSSVDNTVGYDPAYSNLSLAKTAPNWPTFLQHQTQ